MSLYKGVCYPSVSDAQAAACSDHHHTWSSGADLITEHCTAAAPSLMDTLRCVNGSSCTTSTSPYPSFPACDYAGGIDLAWTWFLAAMLLFATLWGIRRLIALFDTPDR